MERPHQKMANAISADDGKINGKYPIFNDILTFLWCKMKLCPRDNLLQIAKSFYKREEIVTARDLLYEKYPSTDGIRRVRHRKSEDDLICIYNVLQEMETEDSPVFATYNLNNIPYVDLKNVDGVSLLYKQSKLEESQLELLQQQSLMRDQLWEISGFLQKIDDKCLKTDHPSRSLYSDVTSQRRSVSPTVHIPCTDPSSPPSVPRPPPAPPPARVREFLRDRRARDQRERPHLPMSGEVQESDTSDNSVIRISNKFVKDSEGFIHRNRKSRPLTLGRKSGTRVKVASVPKQARIFVSRLAPEFPVEELHEFVRELTGTDCEIHKLKTKYPNYSSFVITCDKISEKTLLDPDEWEKGIIIRPFFGRILKDVNSEEERDISS